MYKIPDNLLKQMFSSIKKRSEFDSKEFRNIKKFCLQKNKSLTVYDLETTGFVPKEPGSDFGITEIAMLHFVPGKGVFEFSTLVNPECVIPYEVVRITGIDNSMTNKQPVWEQSGAVACHYVSMKNHMTAGYNNVKFDRRCIEFMNLKKRFGGNWVPLQDEIDVMSIFAKKVSVGGKKKKLAAAAEELRVPINQNLHRAAADVELTALVLDKIIEIIGFKVI